MYEYVHLGVDRSPFSRTCFFFFIAPTQGFTQQVTDHTQMKLTEQLTPFLK